MKRSQKYFKGQQKEIGHINGHVEEMFAGHNIIKAFSKEKQSIEKFDEINERLYTVGWKAQFISGIMMPLMNVVNNFSFVVICVVGGIMVINGRLQIGDVQASHTIFQKLHTTNSANGTDRERNAVSGSCCRTCI